MTTKPKILCVDDDPVNRDLLEALLSPRGYDVIAAVNGKNTLNKIKEQKIGLILLDVMMPEMDGYETIQNIRTRTEFRRLPIVALTAKAMKGDRDMCIHAGASDYITKPVDLDQLFSLLRVWMPRRQEVAQPV